MYQFHRGQDLLKLCEQHNMSIAEIMLQAEASELGWEAERVRSHIETSLEVMEESVQKGLNAEIKSVSGLIGGNGYKLYQRLMSGGLCGKTVLRAVSYALAVTEVNAAMGRIVAAPTAGASGVIPGIILAITEEKAIMPVILRVKSAAVAGGIVNKAITRIMPTARIITTTVRAITTSNS